MKTEINKRNITRKMLKKIVWEEVRLEEGKKICEKKEHDYKHFVSWNPNGTQICIRCKQIEKRKYKEPHIDYNKIAVYTI